VVLTCLAIDTTLGASINHTIGGYMLPDPDDRRLGFFGVLWAIFCGVGFFLMDNIPRNGAGVGRGYSALRVLARTGGRLATLQCSLSRTALPDRAHWGIENGFHLRLDGTAGEDRSRVRHPTSVLNLAMNRRVLGSGGSKRAATHARPCSKVSKTPWPPTTAEKASRP
jgi:hypothetical protein